MHNPVNVLTADVLGRTRKLCFKVTVTVERAAVVSTLDSSSKTSKTSNTASVILVRNPK